MKKNYQQPSMNVVTMKTTSILCGSQVGNVGTNTTFVFGGGSNQSARSRETDWDDEW